MSQSSKQDPGGAAAGKNDAVQASPGHGPSGHTSSGHDEAWNQDRFALDLGGIHVHFGDGALDQLGEAARELGGWRVLLVTDPGLEAAGHADRALQALAAAGCEPAVFDGVEENPTTEHVARGVEAARRHGTDLLVGLGGGSAMDCAKGINFLYTNGGRMADYWGTGKASRAMLPSVGVPTTAGTGSEAQRFALISDAASHRKMACGDRKARFGTVILDPELTTSLPRAVASVTAMDAVSHAVESYVTRRRNPISQLFAREAFRRLERSFEAFLANPGAERGARRDMLLGAHFAGAAIEASMLGAAHSCANPLTARYGITHGSAVGLMLPAVVRFNGAGEDPAIGSIDSLYGELWPNSKGYGQGNGQAASDTPDASHAGGLATRLKQLRHSAGLPARLADCGVEEGVLGELAQLAAQEWTANFNPRSVDAKDLHQLYRETY